jgi:hypothetical protein
MKKRSINEVCEHFEPAHYAPYFQKADAVSSIAGNAVRGTQIIFAIRSKPSEEDLVITGTVPIVDLSVGLFQIKQTWNFMVNV